MKRAVPQGREIGGSGTSSPHNVKTKTRPGANSHVWKTSYQQSCVWFLSVIWRPAPRASVIPPPSMSSAVSTALRWPPRPPSPVLTAGAQRFPYRWMVRLHNQVSNNRGTF